MTLRFDGDAVVPVICPKCNGTGRVRLILRRSSGRFVKCGQCMGKGSVMVREKRKGRARR